SPPISCSPHSRVLHSFPTRRSSDLLASFRSEPPTVVAGRKVTSIEDYKESIRTNVEEGQKEEITLPKSNVLKYFLEDGTWFCFRSEEHTSELQSRENLVCRLLLEKK